MLRDWLADRTARTRAAAYVRLLAVEPDADDVAWLASRGTAGDADHARWELRYARRALGLVTAQRDALDDRTGSAVAHQLAASFRRDPAVAPELQELAERQLNQRIRVYGDVLSMRGRMPTGARLGHALLDFAGAQRPTPADIARAGDLLAGYLADANEALRKRFGTAQLPEDIPPSEALRVGPSRG